MDKEAPVKGIFPSPRTIRHSLRRTSNNLQARDFLNQGLWLMVKTRRRAPLSGQTHLNHQKVKRHHG